jgi:TolA-binding protein
MYPGTDAAAEAAGDVKTYEADTVFITNLNNKVNGKKAESLLSLGDMYKAAGKTDEARAKYQAVIDQFPNTAWAETAKKAIAAAGE